MAPSAGQGLDQLPAAQDGDPVGDVEHLVELVGDEDHRLAARREAADHLEQLLGLLRREHCGRLVEDEDVRLAIERLQDLDALLLADGDVLDLRRRVDGQSVAVRDLLDAALGLVDVEHDPAPGRLLGEDDVLGHRHHGDEHEVLVHHPHAGPDRRARSAQTHGVPLDHDLALVGVVEPVEDVHQRRLAGAVLAEQRVDLALEQVEADVVVGDDPREALRDVPHLENLGPPGHCAGSYAGIRPGTSLGRPPVAACGYLRRTVILPSAICFDTSSSFAISASLSGAFGLTFPYPTPPFSTSNALTFPSPATLAAATPTR